MIATIGFMMAALSAMGNDALQTLSSFIASNKNTKWYTLWAFTSVILIATLGYGYLMGDMSHGRLNRVPEITIEWYHLLAPLALLILTKYGIPTSGSFILISSVASAVVIEKMLIKSAMGFAVGFIVAYVVWLIVKHLIDETKKPKHPKLWMWGQYLSTGILFAFWLSQDASNFLLYLPRELSSLQATGVIATLVGVLGWIFYSGGGKIQEIVNNKKNSRYRVSATIIDLVYAIILWQFKIVNDIPMSTTVVFIGVISARQLVLESNKKSMVMVAKDTGKLAIGIVVSLLVVTIIHYLK